MADDNFRSYRDPSARDHAARIASEADDPLAELARLIGQSDPLASGRRSDVYHEQSGEDAEADRDWASAEERAAAADYDRTEERYAAPQMPPAPHLPYPSEQRSYESEPPPADRYASGPAAQFNGFREERDDDYRSEQVPARRSDQLPAYAPAAAGGYYEADEQTHDEGAAYAADEYYDDEPARPRRRSGVIAVMAVFALAVVGSAAAFGYRAMFGGSVLPSLPPIIKASNGPNKIMPNTGDAQASNAGQTGAASTGSTENLVSREEQPVNMEPPKALPRVVSTIPVGPGQTAAAAPAAASSPALPSPSPWPNPPAPGSPWPNPPATLGTMPNGAAAVPAQAAPQSAPPAQGSSEPKRIHTVVIRSDQSGAPDAAPVASQPQQAAPAASPPPAAAARTVARPAAAPPKQTAAASAPPPGPNAPLSIVPGGQHETAAPTPPRATAEPMAVASAGPVNGVAAASSSGGGYAVQVTSQRSEAEAQAAFRELRAKFPNQLGGREPIIRRADLGAKGTYYRALVGPFASMEEAAGMCSGLKAAGGKCLVQRN